MPVADVLSWTRIMLVVPVAVAALTGHGGTFVVLLLIAMATDAIDGPVARRVGTASARGAHLDSVADAILFAVAAASGPVAFPAAQDELPGTVAALIVAVTVPPVAGWLRYGRLPAFHTRLARAATVAMGAGFISFVVFDTAWPLRAAVALLLVSVFEELGIMWLLPQWTPNVPTLLHAIRLAGRTTPLPHVTPLNRRPSP